ncbi:tRNA lysidine(34) synthetase TilS [Candidatus Poribacteria bacterium]
MIMKPLKTKVADTIRKYGMIIPGDKIAVGISGGPDSMALLYLLHTMREELDCTLHVAHLDHRLRGEESEADAEYVRQHAQKLDLPITVETIDVRKMITPKESLESGARRIRYDFYERVMVDAQADRLAQGHTADDQAETVMMRLLRGSGAQGLGGIPPARDKFIRPLIGTSRSEINEYLRQLHITPRYDSSNLSTDYTRNKIRIDLLPLLEQEYSPNIKQILRQTGELLRTEDDLLTHLATEAMDRCVQYPTAHTATISISDLRKYHLALQRRICRLVIKTLIGNLRGFDYDHIRDLLELASHGKTGSAINLPQGISAEKSYDSLTLRYGHQPRTPAEPFCYRIKLSGETSIPELSLLIKATGPVKMRGEYEKPQTESKFQATFDYSKVNGELYLRNRRPGDRFHPLGMSGTKKLKDFLIDEKIPRDLRDSIPIFTDNDSILWIVGYRMDDRFKVTANTENQLTVTITPR